MRWFLQTISLTTFESENVFSQFSGTIFLGQNNLWKGVLTVALQREGRLSVSGFFSIKIRRWKLKICYSWASLVPLKDTHVQFRNQEKKLSGAQFWNSAA